MPMPYSHLAVAHHVLQRAHIEPSNDYYIGAFMPDVRYFTKQPRETTHISITRLDALATRTQAPIAFVLGYKVHLLIDEIWVSPGFVDAYRARFPGFLRNRIVRQLQVVFELYNLNQHPVPVQLRAAENELTNALGVQKEQAEVAIGYLQDYLDRRSLQAGFAIAQASGMFPPARIAGMQSIGCMIDGNPLIRWLALTVVNRASTPVYEQLVSAVTQRLS